MKTIAILIPAYNPDQKLITLLNQLTFQSSSDVYIVNDGSKDSSVFEDKIFQNPQIHLIHHATNLGKGAALKTGINTILTTNPEIEGVVTADADGQHRPEDILALEKDLSAKKSLIIGSRNFSRQSDQKIPFRSRFGNKLTAKIFQFLVGSEIKDTQSGLRGIPRALMYKLLKVKQMGYDFEMEMILLAKRLNISINSKAIQTIYINNNQSSHFNPLLDSLKIYFVLIRFFFGSLSTFFIDTLFFAFFIKTMNYNLSISYFGARSISGFCNFYVNKNFVFSKTQETLPQIKKYGFLFIINALIGYYLLLFTSQFQTEIVIQKILIEFMLFLLNFFIQREWVFKTIESEG